MLVAVSQGMISKLKKIASNENTPPRAFKLIYVDVSKFFCFFLCVYRIGYQVFIQTTMESIKSVECKGYQACYGVPLVDVTENVYATGYQAFSFASMTNVGNRISGYA